jgi:hypothetical protein
MRLVSVLLVLGHLAGLPVGAGEGDPSEAAALRLAGIEFDIKNREVRVEATVCLNRGILEYLVCLPQTFEHEAIFCIRGKPSVLHLGLLAIGLEPYPFDGAADWWETAREQPRSRVRFEVEYENDGKKLRRPVSDWLVNRGSRGSAVSSVWIFTGSFFGRREGQRVYAADVAGGVVGLGQEGASVLQFGERTGNPYQDKEQGLALNENAVPVKGTKVKLVFAPYEDKAQDAAGIKKEGRQ